MKMIQRRSGTACSAMVALLLASCSGAGQQAAETGQMLQKIGKTEGALNLVVWEGYAEDSWIKPFEAQTGCKVSRKYAGSSDEMIALMRQGKGQYDLVAAGGDATLRLIASKAVQPFNVDLIPDFKDIIPQLQSPAHNTVNGVHYGVSLQWGPDLLMWDKRSISTPPTSWSAIYGPQYKGRITVPDNPIQIANAALYLSKIKPELGIKDPYELTEAQLAAAVGLLKAQRPSIKKYWALASDEVALFSSGDAIIGSGWPYQVLQLQRAGIPADSTIPSEGATGWADTYMLASGALHPNCAYKYVAYVMTPKVQAQQALYFGETPANKAACSAMDALQPGSCKKYHLDQPEQYAKRLSFWKTPQKTCSDGSDKCTDYSAWQRAWQSIKQ